MTPSTAVATKDADTGLAINDEALAALQAQQDAEVGEGLISTPILKIGQPLTREVQAEEAEVGEFINTLTGEGIGNKIGFIVSYYQQGRFAADRDSGRAYVAFDKTIPASWSDLVGEEFVGTPFDEYPDAEEQYKARVNRKEIEWGRGPLVSTTHNFTGFALVPSVDPDEPDEMQPVRLSLQRTNMPSVKRLLTFRTALRGQPFWSVVFDLGTEKKPFDKGMAYLLTVKKGRDTTSDERQMAYELAIEVAQGRAVDNQAPEATSAKAAPSANGGLEV